MLLSNPKIKYQDPTSGTWTELPDLYACDINTSDRPGRTQEDVTGLYTDLFIDNCRLVFKRGNVSLMDNLKSGDSIELQVWDGEAWNQCTFNVASKYNKKIDYQTSKTFLYISVDNTIPQTIITEGGSGSEVTKSYVDAGDASTLSAAKSYTDTQTANMMTTDTEQNINVKKNFTSGNLQVDSNNVLTSSDAYTKDQSNANYVAKSTSTSGITAYVRDSGSESNMNVAQVATANSIARRAGNGVLFVGEPTADSHAATKKYVDDNKGTVVSGTNDGTNWTNITIGSDTYAIPSGGSSTPYTAGNGLTLNDHEFSIDTTVTATKAEVDKKVGGNDQIKTIGIDADGDIYIVEA